MCKLQFPDVYKTEYILLSVMALHAFFVILKDYIFVIRKIITGRSKKRIMPDLRTQSRIRAYVYRAIMMNLPASGSSFRREFIFNGR